MAKYDEPFRLKAVQQYLSGEDSVKTVATRHGVSARNLGDWIKRFEQHGRAGLVGRGASYSASFKLMVLEAMWREKWSLSHTAIVFDIRTHSHIGKWERQYHEGGPDGLSRRRTSIRMPDKPPKPPDPKTPRTLEDVLKENEYLRAENAYLKKLDALIQQKRSAARKKRG